MELLLHLQPRDLGSAKIGPATCRALGHLAVCHGVLANAQRAHGLAGELRDVGSSVTVGKRTAYLQVPTKDSRSRIGVCSKPQSEMQSIDCRPRCGALHEWSYYCICIRRISDRRRSGRRHATLSDI